MATPTPRSFRPPGPPPRTIGQLEQENARLTAKVAELELELTVLRRALSWYATAESRTTRISEMNRTLRTTLLEYFNLQVNERTAFFALSAPVQMQLDGLVNMRWSEPPETASRPEYRRFLTDCLNVFDTNGQEYEILLVDNDKHMLDTSRGILPFSLRGTSDVVIRPRRTQLHRFVRVISVVGLLVPHDLSDLRVVMQVKRTITTAMYSTYVNQSVAELFAADLQAQTFVVAILTNLQDDWTFMWIARDDPRDAEQQVFHQAQFTNYPDGMRAFNSVLALTETELQNNCRCAKVRDLRRASDPTDTASATATAATGAGTTAIATAATASGSGSYQSA